MFINMFYPTYHPGLPLCTDPTVPTGAERRSPSSEAAAAEMLPWRNAAAVTRPRYVARSGGLKEKSVLVRCGRQPFIRVDKG